MRRFSCRSSVFRLTLPPYNTEAVTREEDIIAGREDILPPIIQHIQTVFLYRRSLFSKAGVLPRRIRAIKCNKQ